MCDVLCSLGTVWEKMAEKMQTLGREVTGLKKVISTWAKKQGLEHNKNQVFGASGASPILFPLADRVVLSKVSSPFTLKYRIR
jgi:long-subunit acyl-CoA synthetase (AMP-forming)